MYLTASETPNQITAEVTNWWDHTWQTVKDFFTNNWFNIIKFLAILIIGIIVIWLVMFFLGRVMKRAGIEPLIAKFLKTIVRFSLLLILVLVLLGSVGVEITGLTAAISAGVLAIGVALKDNVANLANGFILVSSKKYKTGDYIVCGSVEGCVQEINFLFTELKTPDGKRVLMPNNTMVNSQVINFGAYPSRRVQFTLSVAYESDVEQVKSIVTEVMKADGRIYLDPEPFCRLKTLGDSSIDFFCHCWCDNADYWDVYYYLMETTFNELKKHGISIPFQQIEMRERVDEVVMPYIEGAVRERVEKVRPKNQRKLRLDDVEDADFVSVSKAMKDSHVRSKKRGKELKKARKKRFEEAKAEMKKTAVSEDKESL